MILTFFLFCAAAVVGQCHFATFFRFGVAKVLTFCQCSKLFSNFFLENIKNQSILSIFEQNESKFRDSSS